jgi:drug/metabolite transporter (DMT)-like permease
MLRSQFAFFSRVFQVLYQTRILTTALFSKLLLKKTLAKQQWLGLLVLTAGAFAAEYFYHKETNNNNIRQLLTTE